MVNKEKAAPISLQATLNMGAARNNQQKAELLLSLIKEYFIY